MEPANGFVQRHRQAPQAEVDPTKELGLKLLGTLSATMAKRAPEQSAAVLTATSGLLSALPPLRMFRGLVPRFPPEEVLLVTDGMVRAASWFAGRGPCEW